MPNPIPSFDHNGVVPPHRGDPRIAADLSPYPCTTRDLCERFATSAERVAILNGFLDFRARLESLGFRNGYQWLDGSFLEDVESRRKRPPNDLDAVTVYWGMDAATQSAIQTGFREFFDPRAAKATFRLDHYPFQIDYDPEVTVEYTRYWMQLFNHNRDGVWKGMLKIDLGTPVEDGEARAILAGFTP